MPFALRKSLLLIYLMAGFFFVGCTSGGKDSTQPTDPTTVDPNSPVSHADGGPVEKPSEIMLGWDAACGLTGNQIKCWGNLWRKIAPPPEPSPFKAPKNLVGDGRSHACVIDQAKVICWGYDYQTGQMKYLNVPDNIVNPRKLADNGDAVCALNDNGIICWTIQVRGPPLLSPTQPGFEAATDLAIGDEFGCAVVGQDISCWGNARNIPQIPKGLAHPRNLSAGERNVCAMTDAGGRCWSSFPKDETSDVTREQQPGFLKSARDVQVGGNNICAVNSFGARCFDSTGELKRSFFLPAKNVTYMKVSALNVCVIGDQGVSCSSTDKEQEYGIRNVPFGTKFFTDIGYGVGYGCALADARVTCWGTIDYNTSYDPIGAVTGILDIPPLTNPTHLYTNVTGGACASTANGLVCWGRVPGDRPYINAITLALGERHACALTNYYTSKKVVCWGDNDQGQSKPPDDLGPVTSLSVSPGQTCAVLENGQTQCWGKVTGSDPTFTKVPPPTFRFAM